MSSIANELPGRGSASSISVSISVSDCHAIQRGDAFTGMDGVKVTRLWLGVDRWLPCHFAVTPGRNVVLKSAPCGG